MLQNFSIYKSRRRGNIYEMYHERMLSLLPRPSYWILRVLPLHIITHVCFEFDSGVVPNCETPWRGNDEENSKMCGSGLLGLSLGFGFRFLWNLAHLFGHTRGRLLRPFIVLEQAQVFLNQWHVSLLRITAFLHQVDASFEQ